MQSDLVTCSNQTSVNSSENVRFKTRFPDCNVAFDRKFITLMGRRCRERRWISSSSVGVTSNLNECVLHQASQVNLNQLTRNEHSNAQYFRRVPT